MQKTWDQANISKEVYLTLSTEEKTTVIVKYYDDMKNKCDGELGVFSFLFLFLQVLSKLMTNNA